VIHRRSASRKRAGLLGVSVARTGGAMARAAKKKIAKADEPSPRSLMERLAALQQEFAAEIEKQKQK